jgi:hypothetical protein
VGYESRGILKRRVVRPVRNFSSGERIVGKLIHEGAKLQL